MSVFDLSSIFKDVLSMESGQNSIIINDEPALWNIDGEEIKGDIEAHDSLDYVAKYGPVYIENNGNLTSNIDLKLAYGLKTDIDIINVNDKSANLVDPFEVIVGDIDNFGGGISSATNAPYYSNGNSTNKEKIIPSNYDGKGTDRILLPSGYYNSMLYITEGSNSKHFLTRIETLETGEYTKVDNNYKLQLSSDYSGEIFNPGYILWCDKYTDLFLKNSISGDAYTYGDSNESNWVYAVGNEPIKFMYNQIENEEKVNSAQIFLYISGLESNSTIFNNEYTVYLLDSEGTKYDVPEWSEAVNTVNISNDIGVSMNLNIPKRLLPIIEKGNNISILIDDDNLGANGDGFCIDFARLTVNMPMEQSILEDRGTYVTISGTVNENGNPIEGIKVVAGDGAYTYTDKNGRYSLKTSPGIVNINVEHEDYLEVAETLPINMINLSSESNFNLEVMKVEKSQQIYKGEKLKFKVKIKLERKVGDEWREVDFVEPDNEEYILNKDENGYYNMYLDETDVGIINKQMNVSVGEKIRVFYEVIIKNKSEIIEDTYEDTYTRFNSKIYVKATQDNNPGWSEDGKGNEYITEYIAGAESKGIASLEGSVSGYNVDETVSVLLIRKSGSKEKLVAKTILPEDGRYKFNIRINEEYYVIIKSSEHEEVHSSVFISNKDDVLLEELSFTNIKTNEVSFIHPKKESTSSTPKLYYKITNQYCSSSSTSISTLQSTGGMQSNGWYMWKFDDAINKDYALQVKVGSYNSKPLYLFRTKRVYISPN